MKKIIVLICVAVISAFTVCMPVYASDFTDRYNITTVYDTNNNIHNINTLPDSADIVNWDNNTFTNVVKVLTVANGTGWFYGSSTSGVSNIYCVDYANVWGVNVYNLTNLSCNIAIVDGSAIVAGVCYVNKIISGTTLVLRVLASELASFDDAGAVAWINNQISLHGNIQFMYEYSIPVVYTLLPVQPHLTTYSTSSILTACTDLLGGIFNSFKTFVTDFILSYPLITSFTLVLLGLIITFSLIFLFIGGRK